MSTAKACFPYIRTVFLFILELPQKRQMSNTMKNSRSTIHRIREKFELQIVIFLVFEWVTRLKCIFFKEYSTRSCVFITILYPYKK